MRPFRHLSSAFIVVFSTLLVSLSMASVAGAQPSGRLKVRPGKVINFKVNLNKNSAASKYLYVYNTGNAPLTVIFGNATAPFDVACSCTKDTIPPHQMVRAVMAFKPTGTGTFTQGFNVDSDATKGKANLVITLKGVATGQAPSASSSISGVVSAGTTPIANAKVNLFAAGDDSGSSDTTLVSTTTTNSNGEFELTRVYCANPDAQLYAVATGGAARGCGTENSSLALMTALGTCADMSESSSIVVNEMTTAAAALALAPFMTDTSPPSAATSSSGSNALYNAFAEAERLVSAQSGQAMTAGSSLQASVASLGNALAQCAQCGGAETSSCQQILACGAEGAGATGGTCSPGGTLITDTLQAAFSLAGNPPTGAN